MGLIWTLPQLLYVSEGIVFISILVLYLNITKHCTEISAARWIRERLGVLLGSEKILLL